MKNQEKFLMIEKIKNSVKLLDDNTDTKIKETILNDLTLVQNIIYDFNQNKTVRLTRPRFIKD